MGKASSGEELVRMQDVSGIPNTGGRPKSLNLLRNLKKIFSALRGPQLYEGYGQRKRAESKPMFSTTQRWPAGFKRMPVRDGHKQRGRYPSISRPR